ncbi:MAG TPA: hypothetical protein VHT48_04910 [Methylocella sp.]|nr:hypothetical protein [Methylocella sp.]
MEDEVRSDARIRVRGADKVPDREGFGNHGGEVVVDPILSAILDDQALSLATASQLRLDRQDDGIEIGPLALFLCSAAAIFAWLSRISDPIGRDGYPHFSKHAPMTFSRRAPIAPGV